MWQDSFNKIREREIEENKKYFDNFPFNEIAVRHWMSAMQKLGCFKDIDVMITPLCELLSMPGNRGGYRIMAVSKSGKHKATWKLGVLKEFNVNEGEIYVTMDNTARLAGGVYTYIVMLKDGEYVITKEYCHVRC